MGNFINIVDSRIDVDSPGTSQLFKDLRDNQYVGFTNMTVYTSGAGNFTVPANVYRLCVTVTGGGAGGRGLNIGPVEGTIGGAGVDSTFGLNPSTFGLLTAGGCKTVLNDGVVNYWYSPSATHSKDATNLHDGGGGEWSVTDGASSFWGSNSYGSGGRPGYWPIPSSLLHLPGGSGATINAVWEVVPGEVYPYVVGAGGAGGAGTLTPGYAGGGGIIVVEW